MNKMTPEACIDAYINVFVNSNNCSSKEIERMLFKWGVSTLISTKTATKDTIAINMWIISKQKIRNEMFRKSIKELINETHEIPFVLLKGVAFADTYYQQPEVRISSDIDILVANQDLFQFIMKCKQIGYTYEGGGEINECEIMRYVTGECKDQHFKTICKKQEEGNVYLEVHNRLFLQQWFDVEEYNIVEKFMTKKNKVTEGVYYGTFRLNFYDEIIYLMIHFLQHFLKNMLEGTIKGVYFFQIKIGLLHDVARMIYENRKTINWNYLCNLVYQYHLEVEISFVLKMIEEIYNDYVPAEVILYLREAKRRKNVFISEFSNFLYERKLADLLLVNPVEVMNDFIEKLTLHNVIKLFDISKIGDIVSHMDVCKNQKCFIYGHWEIALKKVFDCMMGWSLKGITFDINTILIDSNDYWIVYLLICDINGQPPQIYRFQVRVSENNAIQIFKIIQKEDGIDYCVSTSGSITLFSNGDESFLINGFIPWKEVNRDLDDIDYNRMKFKSDFRFGINIERGYLEKEREEVTILRYSGTHIWHDVTGF